MKLAASSASVRQRGSVLMATLLIALVIGVTLASFLDLTGAQHRATMRSQVWNSCVPLAEAGLEEALTHVYLNSTNLGSQGWLTSASGLALSNGVSLTGTVYYRVRTLNGGTYIAAIQGGTTPTLTVQGNLPKPLSSADMLSRTIQVKTVGGALFSRGLVAKGNINWNGQIVSDSFDSQNPLRSTGGRYDPLKRDDNGSVGSVEGNVSLGSQGIIYGMVATGPTGAAVTGPHAAVGTVTYIGTGNTGIQTGFYQNDLNVSFPDASVPFSSTTIPGGGNVVNVDSISTNSTASNSLAYPTSPGGPVTTNYPTSTTYPTGTSYPVTTNVVATTTTSKAKGVTTTSTSYSTNYTYTQFTWTSTSYTTNYSTNYYDHILDTGDYYLSGIANKDVLVRGNARLYVDGSISETGGKAITVANTGTLKMYVKGSISLSGNAAVNTTADALRMQIYGLPTSTDVSFGGNSEFTGLLYAPQADLRFNGGGGDRVDFMGAAIVGSAQLNGHYEFHYDENLGRNGPSASFVIASWTEL